MKKIVRVEVEGVDCEKCVAKIRKRLKSIDGVEDVSIYNYRHIVVVLNGDLDSNNIVEEVEALGYRVKTG